MRHIDDDELVLHGYGEDTGSDVQAHLADCPGCRARFDALRQDLAVFDHAAVPERSDDYGASVWARLEPHLPDRPSPARWRERLNAWMTWQTCAMAGGVAVLVVAAFVAGRLTRTPVPAAFQAVEASAETVRERVLLIAVGDHLERSRMVLVEIVNNPGAGAAELPLGQASADDLVATNRLYRRTALDRGDTAMASALEELERILVEIANGRAAETDGNLADLRERIESQGLLFKVTVLGAQVRQRQQDALTTRPSRTDSTT